MEVVESPLNLAHQQSRTAERLVAAGKYEDAISCHGRAADLLTDAMTTTECDQARLSMELQRDSHLKQRRLIQERWKREARREATRGPGPPTRSPDPQGAPGVQAAPAAPHHRGGEREYDTLLYQLQVRQTGPPAGPPPCAGSKTAKDDKTRLEEQQTTISDLRRLVDRLTDDNQRLTDDNRQLRRDNARLRAEAAELVERSELWVLPPAGTVTAATAATATTGGKDNIAIPQLPPLEMPAREDLCLDDLPPLELPEDIRNELQELLDRDKP